METSYWDKKAIDYDNHIKKSEKVYEKVIELTKKEIDKTHTLLDIGTGTGAIPIDIAPFVYFIPVVAEIFTNSYENR